MVRRASLLSCSVAGVSCLERRVAASEFGRDRPERRSAGSRGGDCGAKILAGVRSLLAFLSSFWGFWA
ncbi:hypothetical protein GQ53DRAFT_148694 [Thozetella sp. PMI_491]|nr:hypothetical protein GQ53DRAFT_148694 [Thozetella sp. PMI_491]